MITHSLSVDPETGQCPISEGRRYRIAMVAPVFCHPSWRGGGVARTSADLAMQMAKRGHRVTVVSPLSEVYKLHEMPRECSFVDGRLEFRYSTQARGTRFGTSGGACARLLEPLMGQCDLVHIHTFLSAWTDRACSVARSHGKPYFIQDRGKLTPSILAHRYWLKMAYLRLRGLSLLRGAAAVLPLTSPVATAIRRMDPRIKCQVVTNGLDPAEYDQVPGPSPLNSPYIFYIGFLDPRKNLDLLIRAFAKIAGQIPEWKLALVGSDDYGLQPALQSMASELGVKDRVVFPGHVSGATKLAWLHHAGFFVLPSAGEGLSVAMIEAMACGLPCLISEGCNYPEISVTHAGEVVELNDDSWSAQILRYATDTRLRNETSRNARSRFMSEHTLDGVAQRLEETYAAYVA